MMATATDNRHDNIDELYQNLKGVLECDYVRLNFANINGIAHGKSIPANQLSSIMEHGLQLYAGMMASGPRNEMPILRQVEDIFKGNATFRIQPGTFQKIPWACKETNHQVGQVIVEPFWPNGLPQEACPRYQARKQLERLEKMGYSLVSSVEAKFTIVNSSTLSPVHSGVDYLSTCYMAQNESLLYDISDQLKAGGIDVIGLAIEEGPGQFELSLEPKHDIQAADQIYSFKQAVKEICHQRGFTASFMTKPYVEHIGNEFHYNHSLWSKDGNSVFHDATKSGNLSDVARYWLAGLLAHGKALCALMNPTVNCYRRLHGPLIPDVVNWGMDDRLALIRIKNGPKYTYMENRLPTSAANPYLIMAATIAAGLDGIRNELEPPAASLKSSPALPYSLAEALEAFQEDSVMRDAFGEEFLEWFVQSKTQNELKLFPNWRKEDIKLIEKEREEYFEFI